MPPFTQTPNITSSMTHNQICIEILNSAPTYHDPIPNYQSVVLAILIIQTTFIIISFIWFYHLRKQNIRLRQRHFPLLIAQAGFVFLPLILGPFRDAFGRENWNCEAYAFARIFEVCFFSIPLNIRYYNSYSRIFVQRQIAHTKLKTLDRAIIEDDRARLATSNASSGGNGGGATNTNTNTTTTTNNNKIMDDSMANNHLSVRKQLGDETQDEVISSDGQIVTVNDLRTGLYRASNAYMLLLVILLIIPFAIGYGLLFIIMPQIYGYGCYGCMPGYWVYVVTLVSPYCWVPISYHWRSEAMKEEDPLGLCWELNQCIYWSSGLCFVGMMLLVTDEYHGLTVTGAFSAEWLIWLGVFMMWWFAVPYQIYYHYQHPEKVDASKLKEILSDPIARGYFIQYLIQEYSVELSKFYFEVQDFKLACLSNKQSAVSLYRFALQIYRVFLTEGSEFELNISGASRLKVRKVLQIDQHTMTKALNNDESLPIVQVTATLFDECEAAAIHMMSGSAIRFVRSELYQKYMGGNNATTNNNNNSGGTPGNSASNNNYKNGGGGGSSSSSAVIVAAVGGGGGNLV
jgi:hypothetical protein